VEQQFERERIQDHQLRMIFMCTNAELSADNRLVLILRTLCGFSIPAIARALLIPEATVKKRLVRTRERLQGHAFEFPPPERLPHVMDSVHTVLYLLFNEGFHSTDETRRMNLELCREAIFLASLLIAEPRVVNRDTLGLLALMQFHLARAAARVDAEGNNVPIDLQDRTAWDRSGIDATRRALATLSVGPQEATERFFIEAKIAELHCVAASFEQTDWSSIVEWYDARVRVTGSPLAQLNRAVALGHAGRVTAGLGAVEAVERHTTLRGSHLPLAVRAHLAALSGDVDRARAWMAGSIRLGGTPHEQRLLCEQVERLLARRPVQ
jgi:RNA polymerase sigma-70 factor (ECF subfamily)